MKNSRQMLPESLDPTFDAIGQSAPPTPKVHTYRSISSLPVVPPDVAALFTRLAPNRRRRSKKPASRP